MFFFLQTIFQKITYVVTGIAVSVGLVSAPVSEPITKIPAQVVQEAQGEKKPLEQSEHKKIEPQKSKATQEPVVKEKPKILALPKQEILPQQKQDSGPVKELRINGSSPEIWATGRHFAYFNFEHLIDGKPVDATITLKSIYPPLPIPGDWQAGIPANSQKKFIFSTDTPDAYTLEFSTDTGVSSKILVVAKKWGEWQIESAPVKKEAIYTLKSSDETLPNPVLVGSFKIKANPDSIFRLNQCSLTTDSKFNSYEFRGAFTAEYNSPSADFISNCSDKGGYFKTDSSGFSGEIQLFVDTKSAGKFYLRDFVVTDFNTKKIYNATTTLFFKLDVIKEFL